MGMLPSGVVRLHDSLVLCGGDGCLFTITGGNIMKKFDEKKEATAEYKKARKKANKTAKKSRKRNRD